MNHVKSLGPHSGSPAPCELLSRVVSREEPSLTTVGPTSVFSARPEEASIPGCREDSEQRLTTSTASRHVRLASMDTWSQGPGEPVCAWTPPFKEDADSAPPRFVMPTVLEPGIVAAGFYATDFLSNIPGKMLALVKRVDLLCGSVACFQMKATKISMPMREAKTTQRIIPKTFVPAPLLAFGSLPAENTRTHTYQERQIS